MRFRLRGPQTIKMKVSRTFTTQYSDRPPVDPRSRWALEDARFIAWDGKEFSYQQLLEGVADDVVDDQGVPDGTAVELIGELIERVMMEPKKAIRHHFLKVCGNHDTYYAYSTLKNVFEAAKALATLKGKKGPTWDDLMLAQGIEEAVPKKMKEDVNLSSYWERLGEPTPAPEPEEGFQEEKLQLFETPDGAILRQLRPRQRRAR